MRKALLSLLLLSSLAAAPVAAADGPVFAAQGGAGAVNPNGTLRYVAVGIGDKTTLEAIRTSNGVVWTWRELNGSWGLPAIGSSSGAGISRDGHTLVLAQTGLGTPSRFLLVDPRTFQLLDSITIRGMYTFDALSPDGSRMYVIQYVHRQLDHYVVRAYDLRADKLLPGRIADRTQRNWAMQGSPVTRTVSADGRWVYTLYTNPGGYPFVHALDSVRGVAHCVGLPMTDQSGIFDASLQLDGGKLLVRQPQGPSFAIDRTSWRLSQLVPARSHALWPAAALAALLLVAGAAGSYTLRRRRARPRAASPPHAAEGRFATTR